jgi:hypothetical protein
MYYPYFRGKQFELITIRETAQLLADSGFVPIIEPVREAMNGLGRALKAVSDADGSAILIVNPACGDHAGDGADISRLLADEFSGNRIKAGILLTNAMTVEAAMTIFGLHEAHHPVFVHAGFTEAKALAQRLGSSLNDTEHVFVEDSCGKLYRRHFSGTNRILLRDGFIKRRNADYHSLEAFSDLHLTYEEEGMDGFGDFLMVGDDYSEGGGPAYAVAIHLTYIDSSKEDMMYIYHFLSTSNDTPTDPAGKFRQALERLIARLDSGSSMLYEGEAIQEFRDLHAKQHFPGLGYVKKLAMKHHIETLADFFS